MNWLEAELHLIAMKLLARYDRRRPTDADDLAGLAALAAEADWAVAEGAVELITARLRPRPRSARLSAGAA